MKKATFVLVAAGSLALVPLARAAQAPANPWLHIRVEEAKKASKVNVNLPLGVVEAILEAAPRDVLSEGRVHLHCHKGDLSVADVRKAWTELKKAGDTDLVTVDSKDGKVTVARKGSLVQIRAAHEGEKEQVFVDVPVAVVDALLSGEGDDLNLKAALQEIRKLRGDIVRVHDEDSQVRIWIDETN